MGWDDATTVLAWEGSGVPARGSKLQAQGLETGVRLGPEVAAVSQKSRG